ncbi:MAG: DNA-binding protein [Leptolyngbyaceae cyanobacterium SM2_5_2]|nr:DNA-binding protein [Leptolyngbyaceae cyanobacterium SM2_5_2]
MKTHCLRFHPGQDLKQSLKSFAVQNNLQAAAILTGIGSLNPAALRFAAQPEATVLTGSFELISLAGTLSAHGLHLHGAVADDQGHVYGGHIADGCLVRTTAEIVLAELSNLCLQRVLDPSTGFLELVVKSSE